MIKKLLVANRGEIACRIFRTARQLGMKVVAVYSDADRFAPHVLMADEAVRLGPAPVAESYLDMDAVIAAVRETDADAVHPGYGFLSENPRFVERLATEGVTFVGPSPDHMRAFSLKHTAREIAEKAKVPLLPGSGLVDDLDHARAEAERIGYPVMLKSSAGGGGIGLQLCHDPKDLPRMYDNVRRLSENNFGDPSLFVEKFVEEARHVEVQIFGDGKGEVIALGERDCSLQRRNQKVVEETPAPLLPDDVRQALHEAAVRLGREVGYASAGTVEFIYDAGANAFYFLEVNTRLQVEHPVTEEVTGLDLVELMLRQAGDDLGDLKTYVREPQGHAFEVRLYAEDPFKDFQPSTGLVTHVTWPESARVDGWIEAGTEVTPYYDPMLAKVIVHGKDRDEAREKLAATLDAVEVAGIETNLAYLRAIVASEALASGKVRTSSLKTLDLPAEGIEILSGGPHTTVQDYPGRIGYWTIGVPPSGPMDALSFRLANRLVGNADGAPALECTLSGPELKFRAAATIALMGAEMPATLDGQRVPYGKPVDVPAGATLSLATVEGPGQRSYLAVAGGFAAPSFLGSRSAFTLGQFGGHRPHAVRTGDVLHVANEVTSAPRAEGLASQAYPPLTHDWEIAALCGPHGAPDYFTEDDIATLFSATYEVHYNSARTGVRLIGPKPQWARADGGEAGLHPSNIHDNAYAVGTIDFTGDMPIILGPDGPSLGGFVCPATIAQADLWKIGQLKPGDKVRFVQVSDEQAATMRAAIEDWVVDLTPAGGANKEVAAPSVALSAAEAEPVLRRTGDGDGAVTYRRAGDDYLLVEFGPMELDLALRFRAHGVMQALEAEHSSGILELTPGIRSLQIHFDPDRIDLHRLVDHVTAIEQNLPATEDMEVESRIVHLPLSWDDPAAQEAVKKYGTLVRPDAPWCPSNIEFIRRINGLSSIDDVYRIVFEADYMVMGLGDVYLGAPVATPLDPRHRLVTTKYNPARTWTPENAVGIGGAYMCVYGMEGPGGYQLFGRTVQMWNRWRQTKEFVDGRPWLLRFFDRIRFFPVSADELMEARAAFPVGEYQLKIEEGRFRLADHKAFMEANAESIAAFRKTQRQAFAEERERWAAQGIDLTADEPAATGPEEEIEVPDGGKLVEASVPGSVWSVKVEEGAKVAEGETLIILESMKMEIEITAPMAGTVHGIHCEPGKVVEPGQPLITLARD